MQRRKPRELLKYYGFESLSESELLALILNKGTRKHSVFSISSSIAGKLQEIYVNTKGFDISIPPAEEFLGEIKEDLPKGNIYRNSIGAIYELISRYSHKNNTRDFSFTNPTDLVKKEFANLTNKLQEYVYGVYLDSRMKIRKKVLLSKGSLDYAIVEPLDVFYYSIVNRSKNFILIHNHPSGDVQPSIDDIELTERLKKASNLLGIKFVDHIIVGNGDIYSFNVKNVVL